MTTHERALDPPLVVSPAAVPLSSQRKIHIPHRNLHYPDFSKLLHKYDDQRRDPNRPSVKLPRVTLTVHVAPIQQVFAKILFRI